MVTGVEAPANRLPRVALGEFLKARRARLSPHDVGLPPGARRRTAGLRREEVALLAGVGITWYTWLEQGRAINVSQQVLDAVARTLRLDRVEREHLYQLAEATPRKYQSPTTVVPPELAQVLGSMDPLPAVVLNTMHDILDTNSAYEDLFWDWHSMPCIHKNQLWCTITEPNAREFFLNYDEEVPYMVARLRAGYGRHIGDPVWEENIRRLADLSPEFADLWGRHEVAEPAARIRHFLRPGVGRLDLVRTELIVSTAPDLFVQVYTPANAATHELLPLTRVHPRQRAFDC